jgi:hypothetical protein
VIQVAGLEWFELELLPLVRMPFLVLFFVLNLSFFLKERFSTFTQWYTISTLNP